MRKITRSAREERMASSDTQRWPPARFHSPGRWWNFHMKQGAAFLISVSRCPCWTPPGPYRSAAEIASRLRFSLLESHRTSGCNWIRLSTTRGARVVLFNLIASFIDEIEQGQNHQALPQFV